MVVRTAARGDIPVTVTRTGRWRHRGEEIDLVVLDEMVSPPRIVVAEATWSRLGPRDARRELDRLRAKARLLPIKAASTIYVLAAREFRGEPPTLPDERLLTIEDYDMLSREVCGG